MTDADTAHLRRRISNQRRELRKLNKHIAQQRLWLQLASERTARAERAYSAAMNRRYRTRGYRLYVWWRNRIVWRVGQLLPNERGYWNARLWYEKGVRDATHYFGALPAIAFPDERKGK